MNRIRILRKLAAQTITAGLNHIYDKHYRFQLSFELTEFYSINCYIIHYSGATNEASRNHKIVMASVVGGVACLATLAEKKKIEAKTQVSAKSEEAVAELPSDDGSEKKTEKGFRKKKLMQYENKIRRYAQPDKVFRYFATVQACYPGTFL